MGLWFVLTDVEFNWPMAETTSQATWAKESVNRIYFGLLPSRLMVHQLAPSCQSIDAKLKSRREMLQCDNGSIVMD